jgi:hypothetical protein
MGRRTAWVLLATPLWAQLPTCEVALWSTCELAFELQAGEDAARAELRAEFRSPHRDTRVIRAFREGGLLIVRFAPDEAGVWDYRITSSLRRLDQQLGKVTATASDAPGFVRVANMHHFQTANLQPHLWMASSIERFAALPRAEFDALLRARAAERFTHLRVTVDPLTDLGEAADRVRAINALGLVADIVLDALPPSPAERERFVTGVVARFAAFNITWAGVPAFERLPNARATLRELGTLLERLDPYKHPRTTMAEGTASPLFDDRWMQLLSYGTPDPNVGAVEHQFYQAPALNTGIRSRADLWNATMNGQYPSSGSGPEFKIWFEFMSASRYWELEPYFDLEGGRALALEGVDYIVYIEKPGPVEVNLEDHGYDVLWLNPATGERIPAKGYKGKRFTGAPPDNGHDWVLRIFREGTKEAMLRSYKFDSRRVPVQEIETNPARVPFQVERPSGDISVRLPPLYTLKITRPTRATRQLLVLWTAESAAGEGARIVGTGQEGTMHLPEALTSRVPGVLSLRVMILNANGKAYEVNRAYRLIP